MWFTERIEQKAFDVRLALLKDYSIIPETNIDFLLLFAAKLHLLNTSIYLIETTPK